MSIDEVDSLVKEIQLHEIRCLENVKNRNLDGSVSELSQKLGSLEKLKSIYQKAGNEKMANFLLLEELTTEADISFFKFSKAFVRSKFGRAWDELHTALNNYGFTIQVADQIGFNPRDNMEKFEKCKEVIEEYPQQWFMSLEILIKKLECSICGKDMQQCNHIAGRAYNGELCSTVVKDIEMTGVSLVANPRDPRCRVVPVGSDYEKGWFTGSGFSKEKIQNIMKKNRGIQNTIARTLGTFKDSLKAL